MRIEQKDVDRLLADADRLARARRYEEAIEICDIVICDDPNSYAAFSERSCSLHALGRVEDAFRDVEKLIELRPESPTAYFRRARWHMERGEYELALNDLRQVMAFNVEYFTDSARFFVAVALLNTNRIDEATKACEMLPLGCKEFINTPSTPGRVLSREKLASLIKQTGKI